MSFGSLERMVYHGDLESLRNRLESLDDSPIHTTFEPYILIQKKKQAEALTILMDDPRFVFDEVFVGRMFYFSTRLVQRTVWNHPKMKDILAGAPSMSEYFFRKYPKPTWTQEAGIGQRYFHADTVIHALRREDTKQKNQRIAFLLYPALKQFVHRWVQKHYAPRAKGYQQAFQDFTTQA